MKRLTTDKYLKAAYFIGGIYDLILGIGLIFFVEPFAAVAGVTIPDPLIFAQISGLFLIIVGYYLIYSCRRPREYVFIGVGSVFVRSGYAAIVVLTALFSTIESAFLLLAVTDVLTAMFIMLALVFTEGVSWKQVWQ